MSRRIDVELTSDRGDGTWSWRAAGARQPKGVLEGEILYDGAQVGDIVRAEADFDIEGISVISVQAPKGARQEPDRIEVRGVEKEFTPITSSLTGKARERAERGEEDRPRRSRDDRGPRPSGGPGGPGGRPGGRPGGPPRGEGDRGPRPGGDRPDRPQRPSRPAPPAPKPKAKKLRPQRIHRDALLASLSPEQQPIAEQLLRGGMPAVRAAVEEQNAKAKAEDGLEVPVDTVLGIAEQLVTRARVADWLDRAEAAKETGEELALRDLRSVVSSADDVARDEATRELAAELKAVLEQRTEAEQTTWLSDIEASLTGGRVVRALRLSSRPPEPGNTFPAELTTRLTEAANGALAADIASDRWATVLDAVAYSPVRRAVVPAGIPAEPTEELLVAVRKHAGRTPAIAPLFGIEPPPDKAKGSARPTKAAGRNVNLSRSGGPRNATVPVPGRPGGTPVPPAKRIPPPPGRQIGATLPGSPPLPRPARPAPVAPPAPAGAPDPTAPLAPPSAAGIAEAPAALGTPEAAPADLTPVAAPAAPEPGAPTPTPAAPESATPMPAEAEVALDAAVTLTDGPGPEATAPLAAAAIGVDQVKGAETTPAAAVDVPAVVSDPGVAAATVEPPAAEPTPAPGSLDAPAVVTDPGVAAAAEAAVEPPPAQQAVEPPWAEAESESPSAAPAAQPQPGPTHAATEAAPATESSVATVPIATPPAEDGMASAPADPSLPDAPPAAGPPDQPGQDTAAADAATSAPTTDALVSQAAGGPFEPPADPPVDVAPNSGIGSVAAQQPEAEAPGTT